MEIRIADFNDTEALYELNALFDNSTTKELMKQSLLENGSEIVCIALDQGEPVGFSAGFIIKSMSYVKPRMDIESLYVKETYRGQGIGKALMDCLEKEGIIRGISHFHLTTGRDNTSAQALYKKIGYEHYGEILMEKTI